MTNHQPTVGLLILYILLGIYSGHSQNSLEDPNRSFFWTPELAVGFLSEPNEGFPDTGLQTSISFSIGRYNVREDKEWARRLNFPKTGLFVGLYNLGNNEKVGNAYLFMPFIEYDLSAKFHINTGIGMSYVDTKFDSDSNPLNRAISTDINWSYRAFLYYDLFRTKFINWRLGAGYVHQSNGHTRLPNQGLNSFLVSASAFVNTVPIVKHDKPELKKHKTRQTYASLRIGIGQNVLSEIINDKKEVFSTALTFGRIHNKTFKFGGGVYYRFYEHYYDYIKEGGELVTEEYPVFLENPTGYASSYGVFGTAELLLSHFGVEFDLGFNISKPFYKIDWMLNEGYSFENGQGETIVVLGELDWYYEIKRTVLSRLGLKYYVINTDKSPQHNVFIGAHINANLGQADFTELSIGYVYRWPLKK